MSESQQVYLEIPPVALVVAVGPESRGKVEHYETSSTLMRRLDAIGRGRLLILSVTEAGTAIPAHHVDALNHYLHSCKGLKSFKRLCPHWPTKYGWAQLRESIEFPITAVLLRS